MFLSAPGPRYDAPSLMGPSKATELIETNSTKELRFEQIMLAFRLKPHWEGKRPPHVRQEASVAFPFRPAALPFG